MARKMSSYSQKEIQEFIDDTRDVPKWGMIRDSEYIYVPLDRMKPDHIKNILKDYEAGIQRLPEEYIQEFERILKVHKVKNTKAGKILYGKK